MIGGARITVTLEGDAAPVTLTTRPVDLFTAETVLGYDPLAELSGAATVGTVTTRILRGLIALAWASYNRGDPARSLTLEAFTERLQTMPTVDVDEDDDRPIPRGSIHRLIVELSLRTGIAPSAWALEHPRTILTAVALLNSEAQRQKRAR